MARVSIYQQQGRIDLLDFVWRHCVSQQRLKSLTHCDCVGHWIVELYVWYCKCIFSPIFYLHVLFQTPVAFGSIQSKTNGTGLGMLQVSWYMSLRWRHNGRDGVSNRQTRDCLLNLFIRAQIKVNIKAPRHWPLCVEFTGDRWIPRSDGQ